MALTNELLSVSFCSAGNHLPIIPIVHGGNAGCCCCCWLLFIGRLTALTVKVLDQLLLVL